MNDLLEDITSRIDMLRAKKHARAYDIALWWEMERQLIASKYSIVDCTVTYKPPRRWRKRYHIPGRAFDLLLLIVCAISAVMALLK